MKHWVETVREHARILVIKLYGRVVCDRKRKEKRNFQVTWNKIHSSELPLPRRNLTCPRCLLYPHSFASRSTPLSTVGPEARDGEEKPGPTRQGVKLEATRVSNCASWLELYVIVTPPKMSTGDSTSSGPSKWAWLWACLVLFVVHSPSATEAKFIEGYLKTAEVRNAFFLSPVFSIFTCLSHIHKFISYMFTPSLDTRSPTSL